MANISQPALKEANRIKRYFEEGYTSYYKYLRPIANGQWGVACLVRQKKREKPPTREERLFVVKRVFDELMLDSLNKEIDVLKRLRGAPHIIQMITIDPDPFEALSRPTMFLEYVENGSVGDFIDRVRTEDTPIPNRILWRFFACLARACIAMAWPDRGKPGLPYQSETFPDDWKTKTSPQLIHGDMHQENILIGELEPPGEEHYFVPILKLIDFGISRYDPNPAIPDMGIKTNIFDIGRIMRMLITLDTKWAMPFSKASATYNGVTRKITTASACLEKPNYEDYLDQDLAALVMMCTAEKLKDRPSLDWLCEAIEYHINIKTWDYYKSNFPWDTHFMEQDALMQDFLHYWIFYPDYDPYS